jgi:polyhydroxyalkanoate synthesis regulator phasin
MQIIKLELDDKMYQTIVKSGIDVQSKFKEFLFDLIDDGYPAISTQEAKKRVSDAVNRYKNGTGNYFANEEYEVRIKNHMENLKTKYANN